ncbi:MAG: flavocytochrome c [Treponemataceae bacterium]
MKRFFFSAAIAIIFLLGCTNKSFQVGTYEGVARGFNGDVQVEIDLSSDSLEAIRIISHAETDGIGTIAVDKLPSQIIEKQSLNVDAISGATYTSDGIKNAIRAALKVAGVKPSDLKVVKATKKTQVSMNEEARSVDVVVIGGGGAGMIAALEARNAGESVLIIEKTSMLGGNTVRATGGMNATETKEQLRAGINDSVEIFVNDTMTSGKNRNNRDLVTTLAEKSSSAIEWLKTIGINLSDVALFGGASQKRIHRPIDSEGKVLAVGSYMVPILEKNIKDAGVEILFDTAATEIIMQDGMVSGVKAQSANNNYTINAQSVIIATGGFGANKEMYTMYRPELEGFVTTNNKAMTGDGIKMAVAIGAATVDLDQIQIHPTVESTGALITEGLRGDGAILVNAEGKRFVNELDTRDVVSLAEVAQTGGYAYLIIDQAMADKSNVIKGYISKGFTISADSYDDLGRAIGSNAQTFADTMHTWNDAVATNNDAEFGRTGMKNELSVAPFYAIKITPGVHHTMGGIKINTEAQVIDNNGDVIPSLYAAGEVTGGIHGANRLGGNAVADIVVFGRIAGQNAADSAKQ